MGLPEVMDSASQSRNKTAVVDASPVWKRSKHYRDVRELLLLHRRYEANAMRALRRATTTLNLGEEKRKRRTRTTSAEGGDTSVLHEAAKKPPLRIKKGEPLARDRRLIDSEYLSQIMSRIDRNMDLSLAEPASKANALRLPKLESIPQDSKAIFYTSLPSIPALPKLKEPKTGPRPVKRINNRKSDMSQYSLPDNCLTVRQLPSDHTMLRADAGAIDAVKLTNTSSLSQETLALQITAPVDATATEGHKAAHEELYWLVPVVENNERSFRLNKTGDGMKKNAFNKDSKGCEKRREVTGKNTEPKYKRNVHFSEYLHEVHLYTPLSTRH